MKTIDIIYLDNPTKYIPDGSYCYNCPFWDKGLF